MNAVNQRPLALIILDGWGVSESTERNAIACAHKPNYDALCRSFPTTTLVSSGERVGLPAGEPGSPESGHLNLGAGRVMRTNKCRIDEAIESGEFFENEVLVGGMLQAKARGAAVHLVGLLSDGGVHSSMEHLFALLRLAKRLEVTQVFVHCFLDGRDVPSKTSDIYVEALEVKMDEIGIGRIATLCGRHYGMDSEGNWERTAQAYTMMVHSEGEGVLEPKKAVRDAFVRGYTDEFIRPIVVETPLGNPVGQIKDGELVIFFNDRGDSLKQLVSALEASGGAGPMAFSKPKVEVICLAEYDRDLNATAAFKQERVRNSLAEVLSRRGTPSFHFTESERSLHLDSFWGRDVDDESTRTLYLRSVEPVQRSMRPEMASFKLADRFISQFGSDRSGFYVINLPASALVAEAGDLKKTVEAVQFVDTCLGGILDAINEEDGAAIITASHSSCENMRKRYRGGMHFTAAPVPFHVVDQGSTIKGLRSGGSLVDVAPTILGMFGIERPAAMTGKDLRII